MTQMGKLIGMQWMRVPVSDKNDYGSLEAFDDKFKNANAADCGALPIRSGDAEKSNYVIKVDKNANYWVKVIYTGRKSEDERYSINTMTVDNIYTPVEITHRGQKNGSAPAEFLYTDMRAENKNNGNAKKYIKNGKAEECVSDANAGNSFLYGVPYDLNSMAVLPSPSLNYDSVALRAAKATDIAGLAWWKLSDPGQETDLTLDEAYTRSGHATPYTFMYEKDPAMWRRYSTSIVYEDTAKAPVRVGLDGRTSETAEMWQPIGGTLMEALSGYIPPEPVDRGLSIKGYYVTKSGILISDKKECSFPREFHPAEIDGDGYVLHLVYSRRGVSKQ
jgi:hypothetical protein